MLLSSNSLDFPVRSHAVAKATIRVCSRTHSRSVDSAIRRDCKAFLVNFVVIHEYKISCRNIFRNTRGFNISDQDGYYFFVGLLCDFKFMLTKL